MKNITELTPVERDLLIEFHTEEINKSKETVFLLNQKIIDLENRISQLLGLPELFENTENTAFSDQWTLSKKVEYILNKKLRATTTNGLAYAIAKEHGYDEPDESYITDLTNRLGATLKQKVDKGDTFSRYTAENNKIAYGLKEWFDGSGVIHPDHKLIIRQKITRAAALEALK